jgi:hypothetical protein
MPNQVSFRYFKTSPEIIQLAVMLHAMARYPTGNPPLTDLVARIPTLLFGCGFPNLLDIVDAV